MKFFMIAILALSSSAFATGYKTVSAKYTIFSNVGFGHVYYNCSLVERRVEDLLETMGAKNIRVRCHGGLDRFGGRVSTPARVRATFDVLSTSVLDDGTIASVKKIEIRERNSCHLYITSFKRLSKFFEISNAKVPRCSLSRRSRRVKITFNVLKE